MLSLDSIHRLLGFCVVLGLGVACDSTPSMATQVMLYVTADDALAARAAEVRIQVAGGNLQTIDNFDGRNIGPDEEPIQVALVPGAGEDALEYTVTVELLEEVDAQERSLGAQTISGTYIKNKLGEVWVMFDEPCAFVDCPSGFRCQEGQCVEHCVESARPDTTTRSGPVACDSPCETDACTDGQVVRCDPAGYEVFERVCGFGCAVDGCEQIDPSNVGDELAPTNGFAALVVGQSGEERVAFDTDDGSIELLDGTGEPVRQIRAAGTGTVDGIGFEEVDVEDDLQVPPGCPTADPISYGVFSLERLTVATGSTLEATGPRPFILLVNADVTIDGTVSVAGDHEDPGAGGHNGGIAGDTAGKGPGGGLPGELFVSVASGAGGGSHAGLGGFGGFGPQGFASLGGTEQLGGAAGCNYGDTELVPLVGGSGGGAGLDSGSPGGHGGGAIQISTNGNVTVGQVGVITAGGGGGMPAIASPPLRGAGGGGSGGAILLEAGHITFAGVAGGTARVGAPGGGGGGQTGPGERGNPNVVPAPGGPGSDLITPTLFGAGGRGSDHDGAAGNGELYFFGSGGGGGGGRIRINTATGADDKNALLDFVTPRSDSTFTVGEAKVIE